MSFDLVYLIGGVALLLAVVVPNALWRLPWLSTPIVLVCFGALIGLLPGTAPIPAFPADHPVAVEHLTELTVLVSLMGVGLALDRPLSLRRAGTWRRWGPAWRLLMIAMPLCIGATALLGWSLGLAPAVALLIAAAAAPTDPVLASDVQVAGPNAEADGSEPGEVDHDPDETDEEHEVRFALTSEAGLNDGLAFPFVHAAMLLVAAPVAEWGLTWVAWDLLGMVAVGVGAGVACGLAFAWMAFRAPHRSLRAAETGESLLALAMIAVAYGVAELAGGYGFLAVFACALAVRSQERRAEYHTQMHGVVENLERLLTLVLLLLLGFSLTHGLLVAADWRSLILVGGLLLVIRPACGAASLLGSPDLDGRERAVISFFGVRGIGTLFYIAYALNHAEFPDEEWLWATAALVVVASVLLHGATARPALAWLERDRPHATE